MLYLVRHGESLGNLNKRYCGITDVSLSDKGIEQAKQAALKLKDKNIINIYSSPLKRAKQTANIISNIVNTKVNFKDCLREVNFGIFENMTWDEISEMYPLEKEEWIKQGVNYKFVNGESYIDINTRVKDFLDEVSEDSIIVSHFGIIQSIMIYYKIADLNSIWDYPISNCDIVVLNNKKLEEIIKYKKIN